MNLPVSVIIPSYNSPYLAEAIQSVLAQTYAPAEIIVVDDGSTDATRAVISSFASAVHPICQENRGPAAARNTGIRAAQHELLAFLDSDDLWLADALEVRMRRLSAADAPDIVTGQLQRIRLAAEGDAAGTWQNFMGTWTTLSFQGALIRRSVFERVGWLDESLRQAEDIDWFLRVRELQVPIVFIDRVTALYRVHAANLTHDTDITERYMLRALKKSMNRRTRTQADTTVLEPFRESDEVKRALGIRDSD